jgi:hypothetical protein
MPWPKAQQHMTITMHERSMPLNNPEEDVSLLDSQGQARHHVSYTAAQAALGAAVVFECAEIPPSSRWGDLSALKRFVAQMPQSM